MKKKSILIISVIALIILTAIIGITYFSYISLDVYEWDGTYVVNTKTGARYQSSSEFNIPENFNNLKTVKTIGRFKGEMTWVNKIEGLDEYRYLYIRGLMFDAVYEVMESKDVPKDFGFILRYGVGARNVLNTFEGTYEKDLVSAGTAITNLELSDSELKEIFDMMQEIDILSYPESYAPIYADDPKPGTIQIVDPHMTYNLYLKFNGKEKSIHWNDTNGSSVAKAVVLRDIFLYIDEIIRHKVEYTKLPPAVGGYE